MAAVDKADSAQFTETEVLNPAGWELLNFLMDARTGLGRFRFFRIPNYQFMMRLIEVFHTQSHSVDAILEMPDVKERIEFYGDQGTLFKDQLKRCSKLHNELVVVDLRNEDRIYAGNRFLLYALYPQCTISMHVFSGKRRRNTVFAIGKSIINRSSNLHIGNLALEYDGGGHSNAGTCQIPNEEAERVKAELIRRVTSLESPHHEPALLSVSSPLGDLNRLRREENRSFRVSDPPRFQGESPNIT